MTAGLFEQGKSYKDESGRTVDIISDDGPSKWPLVGKVYGKTGGEHIICYNHAGASQYYVIGSNLVKTPGQVEYWLIANAETGACAIYDVARGTAPVGGELLHVIHQKIDGKWTSRIEQ